MKMLSFREAYGLSEAPDVRNLKPGTEIEILDKSPGAAPGGSWLPTRITRPLDRDPKLAKLNVKHEPGYYYRAPWRSSGESFVYLKDYGKTWRLVELN